MSLAQQFYFIMFNKDKKRTKTYLKQNFKHLIDILRTKTTFKEKNESNQTHMSRSVKPVSSEYQNKIDDILPVTQVKVTKIAQPPSSFSSQMDLEDNNKSDIMYQMNSPLGKQLKQVQSEVSYQSYNQYNEDAIMTVRQSEILKPEKRFIDPHFQRKIGCIRRNREKDTEGDRLGKESMNRQPIHEPRYIMKNKRNEFRYGEPQYVKQKIKFKEIDDIKVIQFWNDHQQIHEKSTLKELYAYFQDLSQTLGIELQSPVIKKYKNCIYFGQKQEDNKSYEGFIYYFQNKIYYGEFKAGFKHGHGVQINFDQQVRFAGAFTMGKKTGYFEIQKEKENYEGYLQHGIYHGRGKLITEEIIYTGTFQSGKKHGYGEEFNIKSGLKLKGIFKNGQYQNLSRSKIISDKSSQPQLINKLQKSISKKTSSDVNFQIQNKIKKDLMNPILNKSDIYKSKSICQDGQSLFDLINNTKKQQKYDFCYENIARRLPKIRIEGIQHKIYDSDVQEKQYEYERQEEANPQDKMLVNNKKRMLNRPVQYEQREVCYEDHPLQRHKLQSPLRCKS